MPYKPKHETKPEPEPETKDRTEQYEITKPDGTVVTVEHNIETGETKIVGK